MQTDVRCPDAKRLEAALLGDLADAEASAVERHVLDCDPCAQATLNLAANETLIGAMRGAAAKAKPVGSESATPGETLNNNSAALPERMSQLIQKLRDLPTREVNDSEWATVLSGEAGPEEMPGIDWSSSFTLAEAPDEIGRLNGFRILKLLGQGGMGGVFLAEDMHLQRRVALKVMRPEFAARPGATERFLREARAVAAVHNEHIVTIYQVGQATAAGQKQGVPFLAQELLHGETLDARLKREGQLPVADAIRIGQQIATGLAAAHERGLIHRDIKPANVWLESRSAEGSRLAERDGYLQGDNVHVKLLDFGLARSLGDTENLTQSGMILGTPAYMAPEQARGDAVDARADLFSLGCVLYRMLTRQTAFGGKDVMATLMSLATHEPSAPHTIRADVPRELSDLVMQLLAKNRDARPASAREVSRRMGTPARPALATGEKRTGRSAHPTKKVGLALTTVAAIALLAVVIVKIKTKDGKETEVAINVPGEVSSVSTKVREGDVRRGSPDPAEGATEGLPGSKLVNKVADANTAKFITLAALDRAKIPESERFDWQPGELVSVIGGHRLRDWSAIGNVMFHPSGDFFISYPNLGKCRVWSMKTFEQLTEQGEPGFPDGVGDSGLCFHPDGKSFCTASGKYGVDLTDPEHPKFRLLGKRPIQKLSGNEQSVISPDGRWLVMAGMPAGILEVWNIVSDVPEFLKEVVYPARRPPHFLTSSKDGRRLALFADGPADAPQEVILLWDVDWNAPNGPTLTPFGEPIPGYNATLSPDGQKLIKTESAASKSQVLDLSVSPPRVEFECEATTHWQFSPDGNWLAGSHGNVILRKKTATGWEMQSSTIPTTDAQNCRLWFAPDGKTLIVGEYEAGVMRAWDLTANPPVERFPSRHYRSIEFSPDGRLLATQGGEASAVWKLDGEMPELFAALGNGKLRNVPPSFSPDSRLVAFTGHYTNVLDLSLPTPQPIHNAGSQGGNFVKFAPQGQSVQTWDGTRLLSHSWELTKRGQFRLSAEAAEIAKLPNGHGHSMSLRNLRPSVDRYVNLQAKGKLQVWSLKDAAKPLFEVQHPGQGEIQEFALSEDGDLLAAFSQGGKNLVWDLSETPPREYPLRDQTGLPTDPFFTADGKFLIVAHTGGIDIHDWSAGRLVRTIKYPGRVWGMARHPDGQHLATVNGNGTVYILRLPELAEHSKAK